MDEVKSHRKLEIYGSVKEECGYEEYLEGHYGKGDILMARFRSGSAAVANEMKRWGGGGRGVWN